MGSAVEKVDAFLAKVDSELAESQRLSSMARGLVTPALMERASQRLAEYVSKK